MHFLAYCNVFGVKEGTFGNLGHFQPFLLERGSFKDDDVLLISEAELPVANSHIIAFATTPEFSVPQYYKLCLFFESVPLKT